MKRRFGTAVVAAAMLWTLAMPGGIAQARVSTTPAATPQLGTSGTDGSVETVRQIVQCGDTMYAVGTFSHVKNPKSSALIARSNAFAFRATAPHTVRPWNPGVDGPVDTVACAPDGSILLGGSFRTAGGAAVRSIARVDNATGAALPFAYRAGGRVAHMEVVQGHLLVGGYFPGYLVSLDPVTGARDGYGLPTFSGTYQFPGVAAHATRVYNMTVRADQQSVLMTGVFTSVGGQRHEQVVRLDMGPTAATVNPWSPAELYQHCTPSQPFYAQDAAWSADGNQIFVVTTGYRLAAERALPVKQRPAARTGPCDATIAYPTTPAEFQGHTWINYTGCDSLYAVATDADSVFVAGHQRWLSNPGACDKPGPGSVAQPGLGALDPVTGAHQPSANRGRGVGATDLLRTSAGLWIASDNQNNTSTCGGVSGRMGICFLPN